MKRLTYRYYQSMQPTILLSQQAHIIMNPITVALDYLLPIIIGFWLVSIYGRC